MIRGTAGDAGKQIGQFQVSWRIYRNGEALGILEDSK